MLVASNRPVIALTGLLCLLAVATAPAESSPSAGAGDRETDASARLARGKLLVREGELQEAVELFEELDQATGGRNPEVVLQLGRAYFRSQQYKRAVASARRLLRWVETPGQEFAAYNLLGTSLLTLGGPHLDEARGALWRSRELARTDVDFVRSSYSLAETLRRLGHKQKVYELLDEFFSTAGARQGPLVNEMRVRLCELRSLVVEDDEASAAAEPLESGESITAPTPIFTPQPHSSPEARVEGGIAVRAVVDAAGCIRQPEIRRLPEGLAAETRKTLSRWTFVPATVGKKAVAVYYDLAVSFQASVPGSPNLPDGG